MTRPTPHSTALRRLRWLPRAITSRRIFRRWLSKFIKTQLNFRGYFDLYNIPFEYISLYDFSEKKSPLQPGGMNRGPNIFDYLEKNRIAYHSALRIRRRKKISRRWMSEIDAERIDFAFLYWPGLDGFAPSGGESIPEVPAKLRCL